MPGDRHRSARPSVVTGPAHQKRLCHQKLSQSHIRSSRSAGSSICQWCEITLLACKTSSQPRNLNYLEEVPLVSSWLTFGGMCGPDFSLIWSRRGRSFPPRQRAAADIISADSNQSLWSDSHNSHFFRTSAVKMSGLATLCLPLLVASSEGFLMTRVEPGFVEKKTGESVSLLCQVGDHFSKT